MGLGFKLPALCIWRLLCVVGCHSRDKLRGLLLSKLSLVVNLVLTILRFDLLDHSLVFFWREDNVSMNPPEKRVVKTKATPFVRQGL